jgi:citrate lyase beta subunit
LDSFEAAVEGGQAAIGFEGTLVDYPLAARAQQILDLANEIDAKEA